MWSPRSFEDEPREITFSQVTLPSSPVVCAKSCVAALSKDDEVLKTLSDLPHTDHIRQQLLAVHNQLEGMHDLKRAGGAGVSFRSSSWCSKTTDVLAG